MHGNVWEMCHDEIAPDKNDPKKLVRRMQRGGTWNYGAIECRANYTLPFSRSRRDNTTGLRVARVRVDADPDRRAAE
jgi:formylglycine-generating enzyme required for sulfatase activity